MQEVVDLATVGFVGAAQGYDLVGYLQDQRDGSYVVLLHRPFRNLDPYVTGRVDRLTDDEWRYGRYFGNPRAAARDMVRRVGVDVE
jgi:hypothetical protein